MNWVSIIFTGLIMNTMEIYENHCNPVESLNIHRNWWFIDNMTEM